MKTKGKKTTGPRKVYSYVHRLPKDRVAVDGAVLKKGTAAEYVVTYGGAGRITHDYREFGPNSDVRVLYDRVRQFPKASAERWRYAWNQRNWAHDELDSKLRKDLEIRLEQEAQSDYVLAKWLLGVSAVLAVALVWVTVGP